MFNPFLPVSAEGHSESRAGWDSGQAWGVATGGCDGHVCSALWLKEGTDREREMGEGDRRGERWRERDGGGGERYKKERGGWAGEKQPSLLFPSFFSETLIKMLQCEMRGFRGRVEWATRGKLCC